MSSAIVASCTRLPGNRRATSMTVAVRLKTPQPPRTRLTAARDEIGDAPGKLLVTAAKINTSHRVSSIARSMLARRSRIWEARLSTGGRVVDSAVRVGRWAGYAGASSWLTIAPSLGDRAGAGAGLWGSRLQPRRAPRMARSEA